MPAVHESLEVLQEKLEAKRAALFSDVEVAIAVNERSGSLFGSDDQRGVERIATRLQQLHLELFHTRNDFNRFCIMFRCAIHALEQEGKKPDTTLGEVAEVLDEYSRKWAGGSAPSLSSSLPSGVPGEESTDVWLTSNPDRYFVACEILCSALSTASQALRTLALAKPSATQNIYEQSRFWSKKELDMIFHVLCGVGSSKSRHVSLMYFLLLRS